MKNPFTIISVFTEDKIGFKGNSAAVIQLHNPISGKQMQAIAADLNQPATTFLWPSLVTNTFHVKWFAPDAEIGLCGHGSLAAFAFLSDTVGIDTKMSLDYGNGLITGSANDDGSCQMQLDGIEVLGELAIPRVLEEGLGVKVKAYYKTNNKNIVVLENEEQVKNMKPNFELLRTYEEFGYAVTALGKNCDFVSRTLVPHVQQLEDHATGSSHAALVPFWSKILNKTVMLAYQLSPRGGKFECSIYEGVVTLAGNYKAIVHGYLNPEFAVEPQDKN